MIKNIKISSLSVLLIIVFILFSFITSDFVLIKSVTIETGEKFTTDKLGNLYVFGSDNIRGYDKNGKQTAIYSNINYGKISLVDASNPQKIMVFYKDFSRIIFLDNTLSINGEGIDLASLGFEMTTISCTSANNDTWIYDSRNYQIIKLDKNLGVLFNSGNLSQLLKINMNPNFFLFQNDFLFLNNPETGILIFNTFGTYLKTIPIKELQAFQVIGDNIYFCSKNKFKSYNIKTFEEKNFILPDTNSTKVRIEQNRLYLFNEKQIDIYSNK
ncbi:MAG: hypothetical protein PHD97_01390 [Bacteroidales bacterium]|nr:hypothetical protein [Bacteroidales bacterium]